MKRFFSISVVLLLINNFWSQNFVPNHSFEDTVYCPTSIGDPFAVTNWNYIDTSNLPDYFNRCAGMNGAGVPQNEMGYQESIQGDAYTGIILHSETKANHREYLQIKLSSPLISGTRYFWCLSSCLADSSSFGCNNLGITLSNDSIFDTLSNGLLDVNIYGYNDKIILDSITWVKQGGSFIANGGEEFLTIGNFFDDTQTFTHYIDTVNTSNHLSYYYIDDIYIGTEKCSPETVLIPNIITPNGDEVNDTFYFSSTIKQLTIYNRWGQIVFETSEKENYWDGKNMKGEIVNDGVYYYFLQTSSAKYTGVIQVQK